MCIAQEEFGQVTNKSIKYWRIVWLCFLLLLPIMVFRFMFIAPLQKFTEIRYSNNYGNAMNIIETTIDTSGNESDLRCLKEVFELDQLYNRIFVEAFRDL